MNKLIILILLAFVHCGDDVLKKEEVLSFKISIFNPQEYDLPYFEIISKNEKFYIQKSYESKDLQELNISNKEKRDLINLIKSFDKLIIPSDINKTGNNLITDKIKINLLIKNENSSTEKKQIQVLNCFEGYSDDFYDFYLMLRKLASLGRLNCDRL